MNGAPRRMRFLIAGLARSGTTVVQRLVSEMDDVYVPPETHFWRHALALSRTAPVPFGPETSRKALELFNSMESSLGFDLDIDKAVAMVPDEAYLWDLFEAVVAALSPSDRSILGEKTPDHLRHAPRLLAAKPQLVVIGLIRDPREVFRSHMSVPWGIKDPVSLAEKWIETTRILEDCLRMFPGRVRVDRLDEIVARPTEVQAEYASLLGSTGGVGTVGPTDGLFDPSEWWKTDALGPIKAKASTWAIDVSDADIAAIEARAGADMARYGYQPVNDLDSLAVTLSVPSWLEVRDSGARIASQPVPIDEATVAQWQASDAARVVAMRRSVENAVEQRNMERERVSSWKSKAEEATAEQKRLRLWLEDEKERARLASAHLAETKEQLARERVQTETFKTSATSWKDRAIELQGEIKRLREWVYSTRRQSLELHHDRVDLERDRAKLKSRLDVANWKLRSMRRRKWWRLGSALGDVKRRPWRLLALPYTAAKIVLSSGEREPRPIPSQPRAKFMLQRSKAVEIDQSEPLKKADRVLRERDYSGATEIVDELLVSDPDSAAALKLRRRLNIATGALTEALRTTQKLDGLGSSASTRKMVRQLEGRLRELDPRWLPEIPDDGVTYTPLPNRILHLLKESLPYEEVGYTLRSHYSLLAQAGEGYEPVVVTSLGFPRRIDVHEFPEVEVIDEIPYRRVDHGPSYPFAELPFDIYMSDYAAAVARTVPEIRPAIIHAGSGYRGYETALVGLALKRRFGIPMVYDVRSYLESTWTSDVNVAEHGEHYERRFASEVRCMTDADIVLTIAETMREEIVSRGIDEAKVRVVPNAVRLEHFQPRPKDPELVAKYRLEDTVVVGYISNLGAREGIHHLIEATALLSRAGVELKCLIVGDGPERESLQRLAIDLGVADRVIVAGPVPHAEIANHYALIDVFVVPRRDDRAARLVTPLKPFEAMAMERPLLTADLPALVEIAKPDERGMIFRSGDSESLAAQLRILVEDPSLRARLGSAGRRWVETERTWASNGRRYRAIYDELLEGPS